MRKSTWRNLNTNLGDEAVKGASICGLKTGVTPGAGACLVLMTTAEGASVSPAGLRQAPAPLDSAAVPSPISLGPLFLSVVLGSDSGARRSIDSQRLLRYGDQVVQTVTK